MLSVSLRHSLQLSCAVCLNDLYKSRSLLLSLPSIKRVFCILLYISHNTRYSCTPSHKIFPLSHFHLQSFHMAGPDYGVLGATFKIVRMLQVISLLGCIGMAANFISEMVQANDTPSKELVGTLSVVSIGHSHG